MKVIFERLSWKKEQKNKQLDVRVTERQLETIKSEATDRSITVSEYVSELLEQDLRTEVTIHDVIDLQKRLLKQLEFMDKNYYLELKDLKKTMEAIKHMLNEEDIEKITKRKKSDDDSGMGQPALELKKEPEEYVILTEDDFKGIEGIDAQNGLSK